MIKRFCQFGTLERLERDFGLRCGCVRACAYEGRNVRSSVPSVPLSIFLIVFKKITGTKSGTGWNGPFHGLGPALGVGDGQG